MLKRGVSYCANEPDFIYNMSCLHEQKKKKSYLLAKSATLAQIETEFTGQFVSSTEMDIS